MGLFDKVTGVLSGGASADIMLSVKVPTVRRGDVVEFEYSIKPKSSFKCRGVRVEVFSKERVRGTASVGKNRTSFNESTDLARFTKDILPATEFTEGVVQKGSSTILIPASAQPTYQGKMAKNTWKLVFVIDIAMGLDLKKSVDLHVL